jgi:alanine racemase
MAESCGIDHFSVFSAQEALRVFNVKSPDTHIMIMGYLSEDEIEWAVQNDISFFVFDTFRLEKAAEKARELGLVARIHIEVETGMNRTGFDESQFPVVAEIMERNSEFLRFEGICTHYAGAESIANYFRVTQQIRRFNRAYRWFEKRGLKPELKHTACSAAMMNFPKTRMDMVRVGILQYGLWPSRETWVAHVNKLKDKTDPLERVIAWKSTVMDIKKVPSGEFIGYGTSYMAEEDMYVASVPVGYADGYARSLSNQGRVLINGSRMAIAGLVNMSMLLVEVPMGTDVNIGDEVILIGDDKEISISIASFGELSNQLNYELLTRLPSGIPRKIIS